MKSRELFWTSLAVALAVSGCVPRVTYNPFKIPQADIKSKVKIVALAPINFPTDIDNADPIKAKFETLVAAKLQEGGFAVVPSTEYGGIWKQMVEKLGGFFDPLTGKRDEEKFKTVREHTMRELAAKTKTEALLEFTVAPIKANFSSNRAAWHGTSEYVRPGGAWSAFLGPQTFGTVPALSIIVALSDLHGVEMYANAGGIQVLSKLSGNQFYNVPRHELFADEERVKQSVNIALNPLIGKTSPPEDSASSKESSY